MTTPLQAYMTLKAVYEVTLRDLMNGYDDGTRSNDVMLHVHWERLLVTIQQGADNIGPEGSNPIRWAEGSTNHTMRCDFFLQTERLRCLALKRAEKHLDTLSELYPECPEIFRSPGQVDIASIDHSVNPCVGWLDKHLQVVNVILDESWDVLKVVQDVIAGMEDVEIWRHVMEEWWEQLKDRHEELWTTSRQELETERYRTQLEADMKDDLLSLMDEEGTHYEDPAFEWDADE